MSSNPKLQIFALFFLVLFCSFGHYCERSFLTVSPLKCLPPEYEEQVEFIKTNVIYDTKNQNGEIVPVLNGQPDCKTNCDEKAKFALGWLKKAIISALIQINKDLDLKQNPEDIYVKFLPKITFELITNKKSSSKKTMSCYCSLKIESIHGKNAVNYILKATVKDLADPLIKSLDFKKITNEVLEHPKLKNCLTDLSEKQSRRLTVKSEVCNPSKLETRQTDLSAKQGKPKLMVKKRRSKNLHQLEKRSNNSTLGCVNNFFLQANRGGYRGRKKNPAGQIFLVAVISIVCSVDPNLYSVKIFGSLIIGFVLWFWVLIMYIKFEEYRAKTKRN